MKLTSYEKKCVLIAMFLIDTKEFEFVCNALDFCKPNLSLKYAAFYGKSSECHTWYGGTNYYPSFKYKYDRLTALALFLAANS